MILKSGNPEETKQILDLKNPLAFYENDFLIGLSRQYVGEELKFKTTQKVQLSFEELKRAYSK